MPPIQESTEEEKPNLMLMCNLDKFFVEPKEVEQDIALEEVSTIVEIPEEVDKS